MNTNTSSSSTNSFSVRLVNYWDEATDRYLTVPVAEGEASESECEIAFADAIEFLEQLDRWYCDGISVGCGISNDIILLECERDVCLREGRYTDGVNFANRLLADYISRYPGAYEGYISLDFGFDDPYGSELVDEILSEPIE